MLVVQFLSFYLFVVAGASRTEHFFSKLHGWKLSASPFFKAGGSLKEAFISCAQKPLCLGFRQETENSFRMLTTPLVNVTAPEWCFDYLKHQSNGIKLTKAPSMLDSELIFGIYFSDGQVKTNCPSDMNEVNGLCQGPGFGEERCKSYPSYMNSSYNPATQICTAVRLSDLISAWS